MSLRSPEGPLFHGGANIDELFEGREGVIVFDACGTSEEFAPKVLSACYVFPQRLEAALMWRQLRHE